MAVWLRERFYLFTCFLGLARSATPGGVLYAIMRNKLLQCRGDSHGGLIERTKAAEKNTTESEREREGPYTCIFIITARAQASRGPIRGKCLLKPFFRFGFSIMHDRQRQHSVKIGKTHGKVATLAGPAGYRFAGRA